VRVLEDKLKHKRSALKARTQAYERAKGLIQDSTSELQLREQQLRLRKQAHDDKKASVKEAKEQMSEELRNARELHEAKMSTLEFSI
jgi:hypothetical protein